MYLIATTNRVIKLNKIGNNINQFGKSGHYKLTDTLVALPRSGRQGQCRMLRDSGGTPFGYAIGSTTSKKRNSIDGFMDGLRNYSNYKNENLAFRCRLLL